MKCLRCYSTNWWIFNIHRKKNWCIFNEKRRRKKNFRSSAIIKNSKKKKLAPYNFLVSNLHLIMLSYSPPPPICDFILFLFIFRFFPLLFYFLFPIPLLFFPPLFFFSFLIFNFNTFLFSLGIYFTHHYKIVQIQCHMG